MGEEIPCDPRQPRCAERVQAGTFQRLEKIPRGSLGGPLPRVEIGIVKTCTERQSIAERTQS
jgi:hypothetical protein